MEEMISDKRLAEIVDPKNMEGLLFVEVSEISAMAQELLEARQKISLLKEDVERLAGLISQIHIVAPPYDEAKTVQYGKHALKLHKQVMSEVE